MPAGQAPTGGWLLFAYLKYAEEIGTMYAAADESIESSANGDGRHAPDVRKLATKTPSVFAESLANKLSHDHQIPSDIYWGNDGFLVDLALRDPDKPDDVTLGLLVRRQPLRRRRGPRRMGRLPHRHPRGQGWILHRIWSPHFFRDPKGVTQQILRDAQT
jgi:hypothetical protein